MYILNDYFQQSRTFLPLYLIIVERLLFFYTYIPKNWINCRDVCMMRELLVRSAIEDMDDGNKTYFRFLDHRFS
jgi:hypothetical protein